MISAAFCASLYSCQGDITDITTSDNHMINLVPVFTDAPYVLLLKTELRMSDLQHFHWLAGHRISVHIPAIPNMVKERVSNKAT